MNSHKVTSNAKAGSKFCPLVTSENSVCLYCAGGHISKTCPYKNNADEHKCSDCLKSRIKDYNKHAKGHTSSDMQCPLKTKEIKRITALTNVDPKKLTSVLKSKTLLSFNCRSIHSKAPQIMEFIADTDIVLLQETWLKKLDIAIIFNIREYNYEILQTRKPRVSNTGEGVANLFKKKYNIKTIMVQTFPSFEHITCSFSTNIGIINSTIIYYPGYSPKHKY